MENMPSKTNVKDLAVAVWRLERWLNNLNVDRKMAATSALRGIKKYISAINVEIIDPLGSKFDPGLAVEVINNEAPEEDEDHLIISETLSPYVYLDGELLQLARVIIGVEKKEIVTSNVKEPEEKAVVSPQKIKMPQKKKKKNTKKVKRTRK